MTTPCCSERNTEEIDLSKEGTIPDHLTPRFLVHPVASYAREMGVSSSTRNFRNSVFLECCCSAKWMFIEKNLSKFELLVTHFDAFFVARRFFLNIVVVRVVVIVVGRKKIYVERSHGIRVQAGGVIRAGNICDRRLHRT